MITTCPYCRTVNDNHETLKKEKDPKDGDISLCITCGEVGIFQKGEICKTNEMDLAKETIQELKKIRRAWVRTRKISELAKDQGGA